MYLEELDKIIHEGFLIKTKFNGSENWQYNIIHSFYKNNIVLDLKGFNNDIESVVGQNIQIAVNTAESEYLFEGIVVDIDDSNTTIVKIEICSEKKYLNKRRYSRFLTNIGCNIKASGDEIGAISHVTNMSLTGACVNTNFDINSKNKITLNIITSHNACLTLSGRIVWESAQGKRNIYGIAFENNKPERIDELQEYLSQLEQVENSILKAWSSREAVVENTTLNAKFLVVDDIKITRICIRNIIQALGFSYIYEASNGNQAVQQAFLYKPNIITLDISMPGIDGLETLKIIKETNIKAVVIIISGYIDSQTKNELSSLGVKYFISKPFEQSQISETINKVLREDM